MAVVTRDRHGTFTKARAEHGPALDRRSARYFAVVRNARSKPHPTKTEAAANERAMKERARHGAKPTASVMALGEFIDTVSLPFLTDKVTRGAVKVGTAQQYRIVWESYAKPTLADVKLSDLRPEH